jgi:hypothetical protein
MLSILGLITGECNRNPLKVTLGMLEFTSKGSDACSCQLLSHIDVSQNMRHFTII